LCYAHRFLKPLFSSLSPFPPATSGAGFFFFVFCAFLYQPAGKAAEQTLLAISICIEAFELSVMKSGDMLCVLGGSSSWLMFSMNFYSVASLPMVASSVFFQNLICYTGWEGR
jgi:hypothetical protein